ncbi:hypothetical protein [Terrabacter carboxydivorans]|uniref:hypothetical protein n=1 Tax=Terrabacter carboxydivorans TaxID=619730 RepID=UPI0031CF6E91
MALLFLALRLVPLQPAMPDSALDPSWQWALNAAVADDMSFGRDLVFTGGPASSVVTTMYHPSTYIWTVGLSLLLAIVMWAALRMTCNEERWLHAAVATTLLAGLPEREGLLLVAPLLAVMGLANALARESRRQNVLWLIAVALVISVMVVVKGSMLVLALTAYAASFFLCLKRGRLPVISLALPPLLVAVLWLLLGQRLQSLPSFAGAEVELASGYTDAMSLGDPWSALPAFLLLGIAGLAMCAGFARIRGIGGIGSVILAMVAAATVATGVKQGFVRADEHLLIAFSALLGIGIAALAVSHRNVRTSAGAALLIVLAVVCVEFGAGALTLILPAHQLEGVESADAAVRRAVGALPSLSTQYNSAVASISQDVSLPALAGTVDIYSYNQADVLSRSLNWSPRPVFQSYSAYSVELAERNRAHLSGGAAPEWVIFAPQAIDDRYPSAEDGPSWVELLRRYEPSTFAGDKVILHRRPAQPAALPPPSGRGTEARLGQRVDLSPSSGLQFVTFEIDPSTLGLAALTLYKSQPLRLTVWTADGVDHTYRLPLGMARAGFLLSPMTSTASEFGSLYGNPSDCETPSRTVVALKVDSTNLLWNSIYRFAVSPIVSPPM